MRYYLDTNMLVFILSKEFGEINSKVLNTLKDYSTILYVSSVCVQELIQLYRVGKFRYKPYKSENDILNNIRSTGIEIVYFNETHLNTYASLRIASGHKDMNDHAIIAQAISDKIPLVSSDGKFKEYVTQGLNFIFNKR